MNTLLPEEEQTLKDTPPESYNIALTDHRNETPVYSDSMHTTPASPYGVKASLLTLLKNSFETLIRKPPKITAFILALCLSIPASIAIMSSGFITAEKNLLDSRHVTVFLNESSGSNATQLAKTLAENKHILAADLRTVDLQHRSVLVLDVHPAATLDKANLGFIVEELNSHTMVDYVAADLSWLERNVKAIETARTMRWAAIGIALLVTGVFVAVMTRTDLPRMDSELRALRQLGASQSVLLKPLLLRSALLTLAAAVIGTLLAWSIIAILPSSVDMSTYERILPRSFPTEVMVSLVLVSVICSYFTVRLFTKIR